MRFAGRAVVAKVHVVSRGWRAARREFRAHQPGRNFARGTFGKNGPRHIKNGVIGEKGERPRARFGKLASFGAKLAGLGVVAGALPHVLPLVHAPSWIAASGVMLSISSLGYGYTIYKKSPVLRHLWRHDRPEFYRTLGEVVGFGGLVFAVTGIAGHAILAAVPGHEAAASAAQIAPPPGLGETLANGAMGMATTADAPLLVSGVKGDHEPDHVPESKHPRPARDER